MFLVNVVLFLPLVLPEFVISERSLRHVSVLHTRGDFTSYEDTGVQHDVISIAGNLVSASERQAVKHFNYPNIEEHGTSHFLGECGSLDYTLKFEAQDNLEISKTKKLLTIKVPIKLYNLTITFDTVRLKSVEEKFDDGLKISFPREISLAVILVVHKGRNVCVKDVFDVTFTSFDVEVNVFDDIKHYFRGVSLDMWHKIMLHIKRMIETHTLYVFRKGFRSLGASFGRELCTIA